MKIGKRSVLKVGLANLHYSEYEQAHMSRAVLAIRLGLPAPSNNP